MPVPGAATACFCCYVIPLHSNVSCPQFLTTTVCFAHTHTREYLVRACVFPRFSRFTILKGFLLNLVRGVHNGRMLLKWVCNKIGPRGGFTGLVFLRIGTGGGPLRLRKCTFGWFKTRGNSRLADEPESTPFSQSVTLQVSAKN